MSAPEETAIQAHALGRHVSAHPADQAFWAEACEVCRISSRLQPWMVEMAAAAVAELDDERLEVEANLPVDGMTPGEMLHRIMAEREITRRKQQ